MKTALSPRLVLAAFVALLLVAPLVLPAFYVTLLNYIGLYAMVALGLVLLTGVGGLTSFGQGAFVGLGAYTTALLTTSADRLALSARGYHRILKVARTIADMNAAPTVGAAHVAEAIQSRRGFG